MTRGQMTILGEVDGNVTLAPQQLCTTFGNFEQDAVKGDLIAE